MKEWLNIVIDQNGIEGYKDFGLGVDLSFHKHNYTIPSSMEFPWHFHICITFAFWFIQLQVGYDVIDLEA